jgi:hypothetical protein
MSEWFMLAGLGLVWLGWWLDRIGSEQSFNSKRAGRLLIAGGVLLAVITLLAQLVAR